MAWDTEKTKQLLLDAAVKEFAERGFQGARVDRIAASAGVNKERIYQYFGNKEQLFAVVLDTELKKLAGAVPLTPESAADLGEHAGRIYDYHVEHPHFVRLLHWEALERGCEAIASETERTAHYTAKVAAIRAAQERGAIDPGLPPEQLMFGLVALANAWFSMPQVLRMTMGAEGGHDVYRAALVSLVRKLTS